MALQGIFLLQSSNTYNIGTTSPANRTFTSGTGSNAITDKINAPPPRANFTSGGIISPSGTQGVTFPSTGATGGAYQTSGTLGANRGVNFTTNTGTTGLVSNAGGVTTTQYISPPPVTTTVGGAYNTSNEYRGVDRGVNYGTRIGQYEERAVSQPVR